MNLQEIKQSIKNPEYDFLRSNPHLGKNVILLGLGGSYAYGTNMETSDLDIRGCALNSKEELLTNISFEAFTNEATDTVIYAFNKLIHYLSNCNPNTIEILGLRPEHYLYVHPFGQLLIDNKNLFLSRRAAYSFGGYANAQLRRLDNKSARVLDQAQMEKHILGSIESLMSSFPSKYTHYPEDGLKLYVDKSVNPEYDSEIFMDVKLTHYPLRDYRNMWSEMNTVIKDYNKLGKRNKHAIEHGKLGKHMAHLVRLYFMAFDILERKEIVTYREKEHDLLMDLRNGKYLGENGMPVPEFFEMVDKLEKQLKYDTDNTDLPDQPDFDGINEIMSYVNEKVVRGEIE